MVLEHIEWYWMVLEDIEWYWMALEYIEWCWMVLEDIEMCRGVCEEVWVGAPLVSQGNGQQRADKANLDFDSTIYINTSYFSQPDTYLGASMVK